jgi:hypothetical protein
VRNVRHNSSIGGRIVGWALTGLTPMGVWRESDIFVAAFPRSGSTWFQRLSAACLYGIDPAVTPHSIVNELSPCVHSMKFYKRFREAMAFKTHHVPQRQYRRVVWLVRDGRDATVSYYHFLNARQKHAVSFQALVEGGKNAPRISWQEHSHQWLSNPFGAELITLKYEDLLENPLPALKRFCEFAGHERSDDDLRQIAERASFERLRQRERAVAGAAAKPANSAFFRRGVKGSHRDEMPPEVLASFLERAGGTLQRLGMT